MARKALDAAMDNVLAVRLAEAWQRAADERRIGDSIDRGLVLLHELNKAGFDVFLRERKEAPDAP